MTITSPLALLDSLRRYHLLDEGQLAQAGVLVALFTEPRAFVEELLRRQWLTDSQAELLLKARASELVLGDCVLLVSLVGRVFKARNWKLGTVIAVKVLPEEKPAEPEGFWRLQRAIRALAELSHPNIVAVHDAGHEGDVCFVVMEHIGSTDLALS